MEEPHVIRLVIADDQELVRDGMAAILGSAPDIEVVGTAENGVAALARVHDLVPDVLVLDLQMPKLDGHGVLRRLRDVQPRPRVLVLTTFSDNESLLGAWRAGADGFMLKLSSTPDLLHAVRTVAAGNSALAPDMIQAIMQQLTADRSADADRTAFRERLTVLSSQELRTVLGIARGWSNRDIARELEVAEGTVKSYVSRALQKLELSNRTQLAVLASPLLADLEAMIGEQGNGK